MIKMMASLNMMNVVCLPYMFCFMLASVFEYKILHVNISNLWIELHLKHSFIVGLQDWLFSLLSRLMLYMIWIIGTWYYDFHDHNQFIESNFDVLIQITPKWNQSKFHLIGILVYTLPTFIKGARNNDQ